MKTGTKIALGIVAVLLLGIGLFIYGGMKMFGDEINAIRSLRQIEEGVYTYSFKGDYGFKGFLEQGGAKTDSEMAAYIARFMSHGYMDVNVPAPSDQEFGCSSIQSDRLFARNFDFKDEGQNIVIIKTQPDDGYKSISTSTFGFIGNGSDWAPKGGMDGFIALATLYIPLDGINEKGVCIADLVEIDGDITPFDTEKPDLTIVGAIRLVLDYAASVDEAIDLIGKYDIHPSIGTSHHLAIADDSRSVVVEWKGGEMHVTDTPVVTNHCIWEVRENPETVNSYERLAKLAGYSPKTYEESLGAISSVSYEGWTLWSVIYDRSELAGHWYKARDWDNPIDFTL